MVKKEGIAAGSHITSQCPCRAKEIKKDDKALSVISFLLDSSSHEIPLPCFYFFTSFSLPPTPRQEIPLLPNQFPTNNYVTQIFVFCLSFSFSTPIFYSEVSVTSKPAELADCSLRLGCPSVSCCCWLWDCSSGDSKTGVMNSTSSAVNSVAMYIIH